MRNKVRGAGRGGVATRGISQGVGGGDGVVTGGIAPEGMALLRRGGGGGVYTKSVLHSTHLD